jgi:hypothetical protein
MPIKRVKHHTMKRKHTKTRSRSSSSSSSDTSNKSSKPNLMAKNDSVHSRNLINLISAISQARKNRTKSQTNLPARLMNMNMQKPKIYQKSNTRRGQR